MRSGRSATAEELQPKHRIPVPPVRTGGTLPAAAHASQNAPAAGPSLDGTVALARSIFRKGGDFIAAMAFQFASTNLVLELGIVLGVLMGWQFTAAEWVGGTIMIVLLAVLLAWR